MDRIICVVGPTASGKTKLAVELAKALNGEVLSCDSMQVYKNMVIGTAAPTLEEMDGVPHHMIGCIDPAEDFSAGKYVEMADGILRDILRRGRTVILTGGTGLYADSLISGRSFAPYPATGRRQALEKEAAELGIEPLLARLRLVDPASADRLHPSDEKRIIRALEIFEETGVSMTEHDRLSRLTPPKYRPFWLGLDYKSRAELYARIDSRVDRMLEAGLLDEIRSLLASGVPENATAMQAIGYKEFVCALRGGGSLEQAASLVRQRSRNYAKRQLTWFRRNPQIHWIMQTSEMKFDEVFRAARQEIPEFSE